MTAVLDTNVVVSAIFWPGESRQCLVAWAKRQYHLAVSVPILEEYGSVSRRLAQRLPAVNPEPWLQWIEAKPKGRNTVAATISSASRLRSLFVGARQLEQLPKQISG